MRFAGGIRSANADMSNDKGGEKPPRQKSKVSYATLIGVGLVGPYGEGEMRCGWDTG